jgi:hypothetical protein
MLKKAAFEFGRALADLRMAEMVCHHMTTSVHRVPTAEEVQKLRLMVQDILGNLKRVCILSDLNNAIGPELDRFRKALTAATLLDIKSRGDHLRNRICDELEHEYYFLVDRQEVQLYDQPAAFGPKVASKFKGAAEDIKTPGIVWPFNSQPHAYST